MARKLVAVQGKPDVSEALEEFELLTEIRQEIAQEAYDYQDAETKKVIDAMCRRLALGANGLVQLKASDGSSVPVKVDKALLESNILFVAMEILKDLAILDVKVANYEFCPTLCANCGAEVEAKKVKRGA